jgi:hypothetical protein
MDLMRKENNMQASNLKMMTNLELQEQILKRLKSIEWTIAIGVILLILFR